MIISYFVKQAGEIYNLNEFQAGKTDVKKCEVSDNGKWTCSFQVLLIFYVRVKKLLTTLRFYNNLSTLLLDRFFYWKYYRNSKIFHY